MNTKIKLAVGTFRAAGLEARWTKTGAGAPCIAVRDPAAKLDHQRKQWWIVTVKMFADMEREGIREAFDNHTLLGDVFSIPA